MVVNALSLLGQCLSALVGWITSLFGATGADGVLIAVFIISLIIGMFLMPLRGAGFGFMTDFMKTNVFGKKRYGNKQQSGKSSGGN